MLVGRVVVGDQMHIQALRRAAIDGPQETQPFVVAMSPHALADDATGGDVESGEERRRAVAPVVVCHRSGPSPLHRQARLRAVERLDLALLVNRENERALRRIEIERTPIIPYHIRRL